MKNLLTDPKLAVRLFKLAALLWSFVLFDYFGRTRATAELTKHYEARLEGMVQAQLPQDQAREIELRLAAKYAEHARKLIDEARED